MNRTAYATIPLLCLAGPVVLRAQELPRWRVGSQPAGFKDANLFDAAVKTDAAGLGANRCSNWTALTLA
jgi:hypothetical protein